LAGGNRRLAEMVDHDPQAGDVPCDQEHMFQMAGQYGHVVERQTAALQDAQPLQDLWADDPIGVRLDIYQMADADQGGLPACASSVRSRSLRRASGAQPTTPAIPVMVADMCEQTIVFSRAVSRFNRHGATDPSRFELGHQIVRLERTPQWLEPAVTRIRRHLHPGRLVGAVDPEMLMCIDDNTRRAPLLSLHRFIRAVCLQELDHHAHRLPTPAQNI
jgi:hypothetical protein